MARRWDPAVQERMRRLYAALGRGLDGKVAGIDLPETSVSFGPMTLRPSSMGSTNQNWIGRSQYANDPFLDGQVDDFRIYSRALSASEVAALFAQT